MPEYTCRSKECGGRIFESRPNTARCIYCGSEEIRRIDRPWLRLILTCLALIAVLCAFLLIQGESFIVQWTACKNERACNYNASALFNDNQTCTFATVFRDCDGNCLHDADDNGVCDAEEIYGCTDKEAINFNVRSTRDDGSCRYYSLDENYGGGPSEVHGCTDPEAYNFNDWATIDDGSCRYFSSDKNEDSGNGDVYGCTHREAYNFNDWATIDDGSCRFFSSEKRQKCQKEVYFGYIYEVVEVNGECWFAENLRTRKFNDGSMINLYDRYRTNSQVKATEFGLTYNYYAISTNKLCPSGWIVPSREDWTSVLHHPRHADIIDDIDLHPFAVIDMYGNEQERIEYWLPDSKQGNDHANSIIIGAPNNRINRYEKRSRREMLGVRCKKSN